MSKDNNLHDFLVDIADAIRNKKGTTDPINAQNLSDEIRGIETGSQWAVDFGEEIASGNPAYLDALQEDIDYYNEVQRRRAAGEVTDAQLRDDMDFRKRIAWVSSSAQYGITAVGALITPFVNIREFRFPNFRGSGYYTFKGASKMEYAEYTVTGTNWSQMFERCTSLKRYKIHTEKKPTNVSSMFNYCHSLEEVDVDCSEVTSASTMFQYCYNLDNVFLSFPVLK